MREIAGGFEIRARVTPNAKKDIIEGLETRDDGKTYLKIRTRAIADDNKANNAVCAIIAKALDIPKSKIEVQSGAKSRNKILLVNHAKIDIDRAETILSGALKHGCENN